MCLSTPKVPPPIPPPQSAKLPNMGMAQRAVADAAKRRMGMAAAILTPTGGLGAASTTGSTTLGRTYGG